MLCDPRWEDVSSTETINGGFIPAHWAKPLMGRPNHQWYINVYADLLQGDIAPCSHCYRISLVVLTCCRPSEGSSSCLHLLGLWWEHESGQRFPELRRFDDRISISNLEGYLRWGTSCLNERSNLWKYGVDETDPWLLWF
jgi:hypothetical protein